MFSRERERMTASFCFNIAHSNLDPGQLASIFYAKQIGIIAKELQKREVIFIF